MNLKELIKQLTREVLDETSASNATGGYSSKFFLKNKVQEDSNYTQKSKFQAAKYPYNDRYGGPSLATKGGGYYATKENMNNTLTNIIKEELLNEVTYSKFKNEVKNRTKAEQLHKAIREVKRKLQEIDRIVEYTSRMKEELSEGDGIQYWTRTNEAITTISESCTPSSKTTSMTDLSPMVISWLINPV
jgi:hypothetical protein